MKRQPSKKWKSIYSNLLTIDHLEITTKCIKILPSGIREMQIKIMSYHFISQWLK